MNKLGVECFFPWETYSAAEMWGVLAKIAGTSFALNHSCRLYGEEHIETVGHLMWFGDLFWKITNQNRRSPPKWIEQSERAHGIDFITVSSQPFCENMSTRYKVLDCVREHYFPK